MSQSLTVELSDVAYHALQRKADEVNATPAGLAASALEDQFGRLDKLALTEPERQAARQRFERHFGAVAQGNPHGADNDAIDAALEQEYADSHEDG